MYEDAMRHAQATGNARQVAVLKGQLGTLRLHQRRYHDALAAFHDVRQTFEQLGESRSVAGAWHQIGMAHQEAEQYDEAEKAYQAALRINVQTGDRSREAATLTQLGATYRRTGRLEDAVKFYGQAATVQRELNDTWAEGVTRSNLAYALFELRRYDDARGEILRAIQCKAPFGHAAEPWKAFGVLSLVERAAGNDEAATTARQQASDAYLAYRRDGGENASELRSLIEGVTEAVTNGDVSAAASALIGHAARTDLPIHWKALILQLLAIVRGEYNSDVADDPDLDYRDAVELELLLAGVARSPNR
jgi:tetratricopeptide (TPR) repeat protein